jgi:thiol-disulfide isomerase/thioredoxin
MKKIDTTWRLFSFYMLVIILILFASNTFGQITVKHFNAEWNKDNSADWIMALKDCKTKSYVDIAKDPNAQKKYKIAVVPTIIIFKDGEEVARFQADLSFKLLATREEVQEEIDEQLMSDF